MARGRNGCILRAIIGRRGNKIGRHRIVADSLNDLDAAEGSSAGMSGRGDNVVRLGCAEQAAIAEELRQYWQHVIDEGVPEHLRGLVLRFADGIDGRNAEAGVPPAETEAPSRIIALADFRSSDCESPS